LVGGWGSGAGAGSAGRPFPPPPARLGDAAPAAGVKQGDGRTAVQGVAKPVIRHGRVSDGLFALGAPGQGRPAELAALLLGVGFDQGQLVACHRLCLRFEGRPPACLSLKISAPLRNSEGAPGVISRSASPARPPVLGLWEPPGPPVRPPGSWAARIGTGWARWPRTPHRTPGSAYVGGSRPTPT